MNVFRLWSVIARLGVVAVLAAACAPATPPAPTAVPPTPTTAAVTYTDGLGRPVTLAAPAQRVLSLAPSNTELLFALGAGAQMVGRDELSDFPAEAAQVPSIGSTYGQLNTEVILAAQPDLVLAAEINTPEQVKTLEDLGLTVYWLANPTDFAGLYANVRLVGALVGRTAEAEALAASLETRVNTVTALTANVAARPTVFYELDATDPTKPYTVGPGTFMDTLITLAGGSNVTGALPDPYPQISSEALVALNPELILLGDAAYGVTAEVVQARPGWDLITAVQTGRIVAFDDNLASRPGPRLVDGLEGLARIFHPELFQ